MSAETMHTPGWTRRLVEADGRRFEVFDSGPGTGNQLALCLHGFPETGLCWRHQVNMLNQCGCRVWAVNQRGYGRSFRPNGVQNYAIEHLMADVAGLIDAAQREFAPRSTALLAHDWGAVVAWCFAARRLRALDALIIANVPHPACFFRALRHPRQLMKSWYVGFFQIPWLPEALLGANRAAAIPRMLRRTAQKPGCFPATSLEDFRNNAAQPGAARAMINWYRAFVRGGLHRQLRQGFPVIKTPTLLLWGLDDVALDSITLDGTPHYVEDLTLHKFPGVSHWILEEAPELVNPLIAEFLKKTGRRSSSFPA